MMRHRGDEGGSRVGVDLVVIGVGAVPNVELAQDAGLEVDNGVLVDAALTTSDPHVLAIGDVAAHLHPVLGRRVRVEHWQNALSQVETFQKLADVSGLVMTKLDGTARGGVLVALADRFGLPIHAIGVGEQIDDLDAFDARDFARALVGLGE